MELEPADYPLVVDGNRLYSKRNLAAPVLVAIDEEMAQQVAKLLSIMSDTVLLPEYDLSNPDHVALLLRGRDETTQ